MCRIDYRPPGGETKTVVFTTKEEKDLFLEGHVVYDINDYWVSLDGAKVLHIYEEEAYNAEKKTN